MIATEYHPQFFTATILEWKKLLQPDKYKQTIIDSLKFLVNEQRVIVTAFVIMDNHLHIIWQTVNGFTPQQVQHSFLRYTAQQIKFDLQEHDPAFLEEFRVDAADREYQFWERNPLSIDLYSEKVFFQKMDYLHANPVVEGLCQYPEEYKYSSALFYEKEIDLFGFITHWRE
ncbi:MAG: transposase [Chitinophagaceae bacterium]|nr:transposase [Chitinophagaceae bacterium]